ncbi:MAG: RNA methyltransferase [Chryseobacterium sp.]|nr:RNA methyltransferase [Chryseobacterium sp.]
MNHLERVFHQLKPFLTPERWDKIDHHSYQSSDFILPVLEDVYQFRNAAAILRSAEACGFHKVIALEKQNVFDPNLTVTKGAETWVEVEKMPPTMETIRQIKKRGYKIVAVSPEKESVLLPDYTITEPVALIFGTEWEGVTDDILDFADETLAIPMYGFTKSFNVSVAAAICMYEMKQKLISSELDYLLSEEKRLKLKIRWAVNSIKSGEAIFKKILDDSQYEGIQW